MSGCSLILLPSRKATKNFLRPVDPAPLDDHLDNLPQGLESSENWDIGQKEAQVVSSAKNHWIGEINGV